MTEITKEQQVRDKYVDIAIKLDNTIKLLVEVKAAGITLRDKHIEQAERYAAESNIQWVILTNGVVWTLYHLTFDEGIEYEKAFSIDLSKNDLDTAAKCLTLLHRDSIKSDRLSEYWEKRIAQTPESLARALFSEEVLCHIRREIRKQNGVLIDTEDLARTIHNMLSVEAREGIGPMKIYKKSKKKTEKREIKQTGESQNVQLPPAPPPQTQSQTSP